MAEGRPGGDAERAAALMANEPLSPKPLILRVEISAAELRSADHITAVGGDLHRQMQEMESRLRADISRLDLRLERHGALLRAGQVWSVRMNRWSEGIDSLLAERDARLAQIERRLEQLERQRPPTQ